MPSHVVCGQEGHEDVHKHVHAYDVIGTNRAAGFAV